MTFSCIRGVGRWATAALLLPLLAACASTPGLSIIADLNDAQTIQKRGIFNVPDAELRAMEERELATSTGVSYDIGLVRRSLIQLSRGNLQGLRATRALAIKYGSNPYIIIDVRASAAFLERGYLNHRAALVEYAALERELVELALRNGKPVLANSTARRVLTSYLWLAMDVADTALAGRLVSRYFEPGLMHPDVPPDDRLLLKLEFADYRAAVMEIQGDPAGAYAARVTAIQNYEAEAMQLTNPRPEYKSIFWAQQQSLRMKAGTAALAFGRPSLAWEQLQSMRAASVPAGREFDQAYRIADLEQAYFSFVQDSRSALAVTDALWAKAPSLMRQLDGQRLGHAAQRAGHLASMGRWNEAEKALSAEAFVAGTASGHRIDYFVGLRSLVAAVIGNSNRHLDEFMAMEPRYAALRGSDLALYYFAAKTIIFQKRATTDGERFDLVRAVEGGREMGRTLRMLHASGYGGATTLSPSVLQLAKESYVVAASKAQGLYGVTTDDLLDALQLLQLTEVDRDIAATAARLASIPGISPAELRDLQDLQQGVRAAQQRVAYLSRSQDIGPETLALSAREASQLAERLDGLLAKLQTASPRLRQAFEGSGALKLRDLQARLSKDESLAIFAPLGDETLVMFLNQGGVEQRLVAIGSKQLAELVASIRSSVTIPMIDDEPIPTFNTGAARTLHDKLLGWVKGQSRDTRSMSVVATGSLGALPFGLLVRGEIVPAASTDYRLLPWLIRYTAISHAPSISSWYVVNSPAPESRTSGFIAWADPDYSGLGGAAVATPQGSIRAVRAAALHAIPTTPRVTLAVADTLPRLPETLQEAATMAQVLGGSIERDVLRGSAATRSSVLARSTSGDLGRRSVVLFATHGLVPAQFAGLHQPALALAQEGDQATPSLLLLEDVLGLRLNADWVILSACNTASADRLGGDPLSGLARGFFFAGARSLLVTHWEVESVSAAALTTRTIARYVRDVRITRAQALQQTAIEMIEGRSEKEEWAHPAFWAPYVLVGNGRRDSAGR